jgi:hypothetical protein
MPRRAQNPHHPLTRLRRQLSTPDRVFSREDLSAKTGVPLGSIKAVEGGRYALSTELALKISFGVPVNPYDLFRGADPLRDFTGRPLSADSKSLDAVKSRYLSEGSGFETDQFVAKTIFEAAEKRLVAMQFRFLFREALAETAKLLGLEAAVAEELSKHEGEFDPAQVSAPLRPTQGVAAKRWEMYERQIRLEEDRLWMERRGQEPAFQITPETRAEEQQRLNWASAKFEAEIRSEALANVAKNVRDSR